LKKLLSEMMNPKFVLILIGICYVTGMNAAQMGFMVMFLVCFMFYFLYTGQEGLLYQNNAHPQFKEPKDNPIGMRSPGDQDLKFEEIWLHTPDGIRLHSWFIPNHYNGVPSKDCATLCYFHANAGNMGFRLPFVKRLLDEVPCNVFLLSYRGYGSSTGSPGEAGIRIDAKETLKHLRGRTDIDTSKIILFGRSLGGAVAVSLAATQPEAIAGVILENTFTCIADLADKLFPLIRIPGIKENLLRIKWETIKDIGKLTCPMLFLGATHDQVVPPEQMQQLFDTVPHDSKEFYTIPNADHNNAWLIGGFKYWLQFRKFIFKVNGQMSTSPGQSGVEPKDPDSFENID